MPSGISLLCASGDLTFQESVPLRAAKDGHFHGGIFVLLIKNYRVFLQEGKCWRKDNDLETKFFSHCFLSPYSQALIWAWKPVSSAREAHCPSLSEHQGDTVIEELSNSNFGLANLKNSSAWSFRIQVGLLQAGTQVNRYKITKNLINFRSLPRTALS